MDVSARACAADRRRRRRRRRAASRGSIARLAPRRATCAPARRGSAASRDRPIPAASRRSLSGPAATRADDAAGGATAHLALVDVLLRRSARSTATSQSCGVRNLRASGLHASGRSTSAPDTARRSPSLSRNTRAMRSTADAGGVSDTKCVTSLVATKRAVDACRHRSRMARSPCANAVVAVALAENGAWRRARAAGPGTRTPSPRRRCGAPPLCAARRRPIGAASGPLGQAADGPPGQHLRQLLHVLLRIAAVHAERVQLEQLARVVLVQPALRRDAPRARLAPANSGRSTGSCRDRSASPDASPTPAPCPRTGRARAAESPRARSCRRAARPAPWPPSTRRGDWTRTRRAARRTGDRCRRAE